jgi:hypothetical protein
LITEILETSGIWDKTRMEAIELNKKMMKEVALKGSVLCVNLFDFKRASELFSELIMQFLSQSLKMFEKITVYNFDPGLHEKELEKAWNEFLTCYTILVE